MPKCRATIRRKGTFKANLIEENRCGMKGQDTFSYSIRLSVDEMDAQGFIVDNFGVQRLFDGLYADGVYMASCEQLAAGALVGLHRMADGRATMIEVEISPIADAGAMIEWRRGEALPSGVMLPQRQQRERTLRRQTAVSKGNSVLVVADDGELQRGDRARVFWVGRTKRGAKRVGVTKGVSRMFTDLENVKVA